MATDSTVSGAFHQKEDEVGGNRVYHSEASMFFAKYFLAFAAACALADIFLPHIR